jgi:hypothetical protein
MSTNPCSSTPGAFQTDASLIPIGRLDALPDDAPGVRESHRLSGDSGRQLAFDVGGRGGERGDQLQQDRPRVRQNRLRGPVGCKVDMSSACCA